MSRNEMMEMDNIEIVNVFTEKDKSFNRIMVERALLDEQKVQGAERRGGKMPMQEQVGTSLYQNRNYDFTSEILNDFRKKWGILQ